MKHLALILLFFLLVACTSSYYGGRYSDLAAISLTPEKFAGKVVILKGWGWGWMTKRPEEVAKDLPLASGFVGLNKNYGTFSDGKYYILIPLSPRFSGKVIVKGKVKLLKKGWTLIVEKVIHEK